MHKFSVSKDMKKINNDIENKYIVKYLYLIRIIKCETHIIDIYMV